MKAVTLEPISRIQGGNQLTGFKKFIKPCIIISGIG